MDVWGCPLDLTLTNEIIEQEQIGPGEALFFPGLFARHSGKNATSRLCVSARSLLCVMKRYLFSANQQMSTWQRPIQLEG